ncbi:MAG: protein translocase subunit SecF [Bacteroidetes bacterium]|nr:protein translocase subunit SecF [Bacteroidota bacterium]MBU1115810.1 protein translocase subunit SecF [Bacteroidota bacterium]MBU1800203.1 protein translocase subunit SecF [Bacteroidota bacterium]
MKVFENINIDFISKRKVAYIVSGTLIILGLLSLAFRGLEFGIDFKGGTDIALKFDDAINISQIRAELEQLGLGNIEVKTFGGETGILLRTELQSVPTEIYGGVITGIQNSILRYEPNAQISISDSTDNSVTIGFADIQIANKVDSKLQNDGFQTSRLDDNNVIIRVGIADWIEGELRNKMPDNHFVVQKEDHVGPKIGSELKQDSIISVVLALLGILIYLGFRFKFIFALGAVVALFHDVLITLGVFALLHGIIPGLNLEISISVVAAFLTLVGYSINDTVVVFDRIRENIKIHKTASLLDNINNAINITMRRTIITSLTTLFVVAVLLIFGGDVLRGFAFALTFGIIVGTYSSIFVASPFIYEYVQRTKKNIQF